MLTKLTLLKEAPSLHSKKKILLTLHPTKKVIITPNSKCCGFIKEKWNFTRLNAQSCRSVTNKILIKCRPIYPSSKFISKCIPLFVTILFGKIFDAVMLFFFYSSTYIFALLTVSHIYDEYFASSRAQFKRFKVEFCWYIMLMHIFATIILPVLESTTHESSRRMLHSTHVKVVKQTSTLFLSLYFFLKRG